MTPKEYADIKLTIVTSLLAIGGLETDLAEKWFQWVIKLPDNALLRVDLPSSSLGKFT